MTEAVIVNSPIDIFCVSMGAVWEPYGCRKSFGFRIVWEPFGSRMGAAWEPYGSLRIWGEFLP